MQKLETRTCFVYQPSQYVIFDTRVPIKLTLIKTICDALDDAFSLLCALRGPPRVPMFGLSVLNVQKECLFPLQEANGKYSILSQVLSRVLQLVKSDGMVGDISPKLLTNAVNDVLHQCESVVNQMTNSRNVSSRSTGFQLHLTILTSTANEQNVLSNIKDWLNDSAVENDYLSKINVIVIHDEFDLENSSPSQRSSNESTELPIDVRHFNGTDPDASGEYFRSWCLEYSTDNDHLRILLPPADLPLTLRCDTQSISISTSSLPFSYRFHLTSHDVTMTPSTLTSNTNQSRGKEVPIYSLEVECIINQNGLREILLFGDPLLVYPTLCWKLSWDEVVTNKNTFNQLCSQLKQNNQVLLLRLQGGPTKSVSGKFVMIPSDGYMLLKNVVCSELLLPFYNAQPHQTDNHEQEDVRHRLAELPTLNEYNPLHHETGLYEGLKSLFNKTVTKDVVQIRPNPAIPNVAPIPKSTSNKSFDQMNSNNINLTKTEMNQYHTRSHLNNDVSTSDTIINMDKPRPILKNSKQNTKRTNNTLSNNSSSVGQSSHPAFNSVQQSSVGGGRGRGGGIKRARLLFSNKSQTAFHDFD